MMDDLASSNSTSNEIIRFRTNLLRWGETNTRSYPWRYIDDPYQVIVSEFMLHRTQARQVKKIYEQFIALCPTFAEYARADRTVVEQILRPLGLQWRIQGMLDALDEFWHSFSGIPSDFNTLISVPTVGQYIAGAVICFTFNRPYTLVDSNIVRVVGRVFGLDLRGEARRKKPIIQAITDVVDPVQPRDFYYATIDLAHMLCRPQDPACASCPLMAIPCQFADNILKKQALISL